MVGVSMEDVLDAVSGSWPGVWVDPWFDACHHELRLCNLNRGTMEAMLRVTGGLDRSIGQTYNRDGAGRSTKPSKEANLPHHARLSIPPQSAALPRLPPRQATAAQGEPPIGPGGSKVWQASREASAHCATRHRGVAAFTMLAALRWSVGRQGGRRSARNTNLQTAAKLTGTPTGDVESLEFRKSRPEQSTATPTGHTHECTFKARCEVRADSGVVCQACWLWRHPSHRAAKGVQGFARLCEASRSVAGLCGAPWNFVRLGAALRGLAGLHGVSHGVAKSRGAFLLFAPRIHTVHECLTRPHVMLAVRTAAERALRQRSSAVRPPAVRHQRSSRPEPTNRNPQASTSPGRARSQRRER